jgi:hypothetical protein
LWLNKGSTICLRWEADASSLNQLEGVVIKGYFFVFFFFIFFFYNVIIQESHFSHERFILVSQEKEG